MSAQHEDGFKCRLTLTNGNVREFLFFKSARYPDPKSELDVLSFTTGTGVEHFVSGDIATIQIGLPETDLSGFPL